MADPALRRKRVAACDVCRARKVKCNGQIPCEPCIARGEFCERTAKKRRRTTEEKDSAVVERLSRLESLFQLSQNQPQDVPSLPQTASLAKSDSTPLDYAGSESTTIVPPNIASPSRNSKSVVPSLDYGTFNAGSLNKSSTALQDEQIGPEDASIFSAADKGNVKFHGHHSFLSFFSHPVIKWVSSRLGNNEFHEVAAQLLPWVARELFQLRKPLSRERKPDPTPEQAFEYVHAYFSESPEAPFGVVNRHSFERRLQAHFAGTRDTEYDPVWFALRNVIFAGGCRIAKAKSLGFRKAVEMAEGWYENALSVHTELLYMQTSVLAVQALVAMAYYTEAIGGPIMPYMIASCAIKLACSKGLNCKIPLSRGVSDINRHHRDKIFWAAYCIDRNVSASSGRPVTISDDSITCDSPHDPTAESTIDTWYSTVMTRLAQLHSFVGAQLYSPKNNMSPTEFVQTVESFTAQLSHIERIVSPYFDLTRDFDSSLLATGLHRDMALRVLFKYHELVFRIHQSLVYPWLRPKWDSAQPESMQQAVENSIAVLIRTSRQALIALSEVRIDPNTRLSIVFVVPLTACANIFIHLLSQPTNPAYQSNLTVLELGVAHFARLELYTESKWAVSLARDMVRLIVNHRAASEQNIENGDASVSNPGIPSPDAYGAWMAYDTSGDFDQFYDLAATKDVLDFDWLNFDFDDWRLNGWV